MIIGTKYEKKVAQAAPTIPYVGIKNMFNNMFVAIPPKEVMRIILLEFFAIRY